MSTATPIPPMPSSVFGELGQFFVAEHAEEMPLGLATLRIQTSGHQTDDRKRGTWHVSLRIGKSVLAQMQCEWCAPEKARAQALAWARESLRGVAEASASVDTVLEPEPAETIREDVAALTGGAT